MPKDQLDAWLTISALYTSRSLSPVPEHRWRCAFWADEALSAAPYVPFFDARAGLTTLCRHFEIPPVPDVAEAHPEAYAAAVKLLKGMEPTNPKPKTRNNIEL